MMVITGVKALSLGELQYSPQVIHPGDDVDLWIKVTNNDDKDLKNIEISIKPHYPFELKQVNPKKGTATIHHLNPGESDVVYLKLHINESAISGNYRLDITVSYDKVEYERGEEILTHYNWTKVYYIPVYGTPNFEIVLANNFSSLIPGRTKTISIIIYNKGTGKGKECTLTIGGNQYISPVGGTKFYLGTIKPQEGKLVNLKLYTDGDTPEGIYLVPATISWIDEDGTKKSEKIDIGLTVEGEILLGISNVITTPREIKPGDTCVRIDVTITNNGEGEAKDVKLHLKTTYPFRDSWSNANYKSIGTLRGGESKTVSFTVDIDEDAVSKHYKLPIEIEYLDISNRKYNITETIEIYVKSKSTDPKFEIVLANNSSSLTPGRTKTIPIVIYNKGSKSANDCFLSVKGNQYISPVGSTKFYLDTIKSQERKVINLKLYTDGDTPEGTYLIPITVSWIDENDTEKSENIDIGLTVQGEILLGISNVITTPREIKPGDSYVRIDVTITNNGHGEAKDIKVRLKTSYPFKDSWSNANYKSIGTLRGGESKTVSFTVDVDKYAPSKHYKIPIYIEYLDTFNKRHNITENIDIYIKSKPVLEILSKEYTVKAGKDNILLITVKNVGNEKAESVRITAIRNSAQPFDYPRKSDTIGTLNPGENGTGAIVVSVDKNALPKEYLITLEIRAVGDRDMGDDNVYIVQKSVKVKVERENKISFLLYGGIAVVIIIGIIYFLRKKILKKRSL